MKYGELIISNKGWYYYDGAFDIIGPFKTKEEAEESFIEFKEEENNLFASMDAHFYQNHKGITHGS